MWQIVLKRDRRKSNGLSYESLKKTIDIAAIFVILYVKIYTILPLSGKYGNRRN